MAANWFELGLALGLPTKELKTIAIKRFNEMDRHSLMISLWIHDTSTASWKSLVLALCHPLVNRRDIAKRIFMTHQIDGKLC